ncbi:MAG: hypothetical protein GC186_09830 [Rhodobacteraceae bacterium]|nr:hypothetical protein [Paracoccaceae bacterium]
MTDPRSGKAVHLPSPEEDAEINRGIAEDPDTMELDDDFFARAKPLSAFPELERIIRGRPPLPEAAKKQRVTLYLDPDVLARLKADGKGWQTRANAALRRALGL